jgi:predicted Zn-dependent peptidase
MLTVKYGSIHQEFKLSKGNEIITTPAGVAHFLEHKMFEMPEGVDASNLFAELGADVNAYTSHENTSYYFQTVMNFDKALELLLDFVQTPYFEEESVESEKLIIEQEIMSSLDRPSSVCYQGILKNLFEKNKIIDDIGGTKESINLINKDILQMCYNTFYHPSNMILVCAGNFDLESTLELIKNNQNNKDFPPYLNPEVIYHLESNKVNKEYNSFIMDVNTSCVSVGLKLDLSSKSPKEILKIAVLFDFILEEQFDYSSKNYQKWLREHIIDYTFTFNFSLCKTYAYITIDGQATDSNVFIDTMRKELLNIPNIKFDEERFNNFIRSHIAYQIRKFNSVEAIANSLNDEYIDGTELFDKKETLQNLKLSDIKEVYEYCSSDALSSFVVLPKEN